MTPRLFFTEDGLTAQVDVLSCAPCDDGFAVVLSRTPFHPQGGGQPSDTGWIGDSEVIKVFHDVEHVVHVVNAAVQTGKNQARVDAAPFEYPPAFGRSFDRRLWRTRRLDPQQSASLAR